MVRRTRSRRPRERRDKGVGGISAPSRSRRQSNPWEGVGNRVRTSYEVLGHPQSTIKPAREGVHYKVLAYTDWGDQFIPTVIQWNHGEVDDLTDLGKSRKNLEKARKHLGGLADDVVKQREKQGLNQSIKIKPSENLSDNELKTRILFYHRFGNQFDYRLETDSWGGYAAEWENRFRYNRLYNADNETKRVIDKYIEGKSREELEKTYDQIMKKRQRSKIKAPAKAQIRIDGRTYLEHTGAYNKAEAKRKAAEIRSRGYYARVVKTGSGYTVYAAKKEA